MLLTAEQALTRNSGNRFQWFLFKRRRLKNTGQYNRAKSSAVGFLVSQELTVLDSY